MVNSSLDKVNELLKLMSGDTARLEEMKERLEKGKTLFNSDNNYLQKLIDGHGNKIQKITESKNSEPEPYEQYRPKPQPEPQPEPYEQYQPEPQPEPIIVKDGEGEYANSKKSTKKKKGFVGIWASCIFFIVGVVAYFIPFTDTRNLTFAQIPKICEGGPAAALELALRGFTIYSWQDCINATFGMQIVNVLLFIGIILFIYWVYKKIT